MAKTRMIMDSEGPRAVAGDVSPFAVYRRNPKLVFTGAVAGAMALALVMALVEIPNDESCYNPGGGLTAKLRPAATEVQKPSGVSVVPGSAGKLYKDFRAIGYRLEDVMAGTGAVPRVFVKAMPSDLRHLNSIDTRKQIFIKTILPLILRVNEDLRHDRTRIATLANRMAEGGVLIASERAWLDGQYERHGVSKGNAALLLRRADVIPPSLALAQAAEESGWGTSRFAQEGRALFGQRAHADGIGLVPVAYAGESAIKVKSFDALLDGVRSYARNLNTHNAYTGFRKLRAQMRSSARDVGGLDSLRLIETLERYSVRGPDYVDSIKAIIRVNNLRRLDGARLSEHVAKNLTLIGA